MLMREQTDDTAAVMAGNDSMSTSVALPAGMQGKDINTIRTPPFEEDDSSLSPAGVDSLGRSSTDSSRRGQWQLDVNGAWRYGSSDSTAGTAASSMCSSIAAEDSTNDASNSLTTSRKRMSDGSLKQPALISGGYSQDGAADSSFTAQQPSTTTSRAPLKKKRGRPSNVELARRREEAGLPALPPKDNKAKPLAPKAPQNTAAKALPASPKLPRVSQRQTQIRPRSSIPTRLPADLFASQCIEAAYASRLDPYSLSAGEHELLGNLLMSKEVTMYLNIRNAILRLWTQNSLCSVTPEEATGCAKETRCFGLATVAYAWLTRNGYINFGCVHVPRDPALPKRFPKDSRQRTVVVIGAGVSGLTTARQLENLFIQQAVKWVNMGERPPRVVVLEGRKRIGGRVYSKPLRSQVKNSLPGDTRNTAEMGAMIVTGFEHGNPLNTIIRGQLGLPYHLMRDALTIYDCDGRPVDEEKDTLNTELYTDITDRAGEYRAIPQKQDTLRGDEDLINRCRDPAPDGFAAFQLEPLPEAHIKSHKPAARRGRRRNAPPGTEKLTGRSQVIEGGSATHSAARAAKNMGWEVKPVVARNQSISLHRAAAASAHPSLGTVMDEAIIQYQDLVDLKPLDMRLLNWHHANLEYANAAPVSWLSLSGHDQDTGNEFEGAHSEVIGGYTQVPRGLMNLPTKLDVRFNRIVESIHYDNGDEDNGVLSTKVVCTDGEVIEADEVVITAPLGVLKSRSIDFDPPLPGWKQGAIDRMGFGLLNKIVLLYEAPFWDDERDMFGLLNEAEQKGSLNPAHYERNRGRFYLIWNASKTSGRPMLIALMAGHAAHDAEYTDTSTLLAEVSARLRSVFTSVKVPAPIEVIVTRWKTDPFTRGTYSFVAPDTRPGDYDLMARSVGNLHFAGEATCGTHPATVHGALLSGLRVASEVMDAMAGLINLPDTLVGPGPIKHEAYAQHTMAQQHLQAPFAAVTGQHDAVSQQPGEPFIKQEEDTINVANTPAANPGLIDGKPSAPPGKSVCAGDPSYWVSPNFGSSDLNYEAAVVARILSELGDRPMKPARPGVNPFLLFTKAKWDECKAFCATQRMPAGRDVIRQTIGKWWKALDDAERQPYLVQSQAAQELADVLRKDYETGVVRWDHEALRIRKEYAREHPPPPEASVAGGNGVSKRKTNVSSCIVLDHV